MFTITAGLQRAKKVVYDNLETSKYRLSTTLVYRHNNSYDMHSSSMPVDHLRCLGRWLVNSGVVHLYMKKNHRTVL